MSDISSKIDAAGRLRVSQLNTLLDLKLFNDDQPLLVDRVNIGTASQIHDGTDGVDMSVTTTGDAAIAQTFKRSSYFSGKSQLIELTFDNFQSQTDVVKRVGYFSSNTVSPYDSNKDGIWFESDGETYRLIIQKDGVEIENAAIGDWTVQHCTEWFDPTKFNVLVIQFLYLGGTAIRFGFIRNGAIAWVHQYVHAGEVSGTFINSPQQPVRYEIRSTGGAGSFKQICAQVASEGSTGEAGIPSVITSVDNSLQTKDVNYSVLGFRLKEAYKEIAIDRERISLNATTQDNLIWRLCVNPTFASPPTYVDRANNAIQEFTGVFTITDLGYVLDAGVQQGNSSSNQSLISKIKPGYSIDGTPDEFVLVVTPRSNTLTVDATITLTELR